MDHSLASSRSADPVRPEGLSFAAVLLGAFSAAVLQLFFTLLGSAVGLAELPHVDGGSGLTVGTAIYAGITLFVSFFAGAWLAARLSASSTRLSATSHGFGVFALVTVTFVFFVGSQLAASVGGLAARAGIGAGAAAGGMDESIKRLREMRIVTDMSLIKGKAITRFQLPDRAGASGASALKGARQKAATLAQDPAAKTAARDAAETARKAGIFASWTALAALAVGALASILGGWVGRIPPAARQVKAQSGWYGRSAA